MYVLYVDVEFANIPLPFRVSLDFFFVSQIFIHGHPSEVCMYMYARDCVSVGVVGAIAPTVSEEIPINRQHLHPQI